MVLLRDLHHTTVATWEIKLRAALVASIRWPYRMWAQDATMHAVWNASSGASTAERDIPAHGWKFLVNQYRSDATNSHIWQSSKLHVTELTSWYTPFPITEDVDPVAAMKQVERRHMLGDLQVVRDGSGLGTLAIIRKSLRSLGGVTDASPEAKVDGMLLDHDQAGILQQRACPGALCDFDDVPVECSEAENIAADLALAVRTGDVTACMPETVDIGASGSGSGLPLRLTAGPAESRAPSSGPAPAPVTPVAAMAPDDSNGAGLAAAAAAVGVLQIWLAVTDAGPDEQKVKQYLEAMLNPLPFVALFTIDCLLHQYQLMVKGELTLLDTLFKSLFKADYQYFGALCKVMIVWREYARDIYDVWAEDNVLEAHDFARLVPPKCIRGRWGAISRCQEFILRPPAGRLVTILTKAFEAMSKKRTSKKRKTPAPVLDEVGQESTEAFRVKMGKYQTAALTSLRDPKFWILTRISLRCRKPLDGFAHYIAKKRRPDTHLALARLVHGRCDDFVQQLHNLTSGIEQWPEITEISLATDIPQAERDELVDISCNAAAQIGARNEVDFHTRVKARVDSMPMQLLVLAKQQPDKVCPERKELCEHLLDRPDEGLHPTARKFKHVFRPYLHSCARMMGKLPVPLCR